MRRKWKGVFAKAASSSSFLGGEKETGPGVFAIYILYFERYYILQNYIQRYWTILHYSNKIWASSCFRPAVSPFRVLIRNGIVPFFILRSLVSIGIYRPVLCNDVYDSIIIDFDFEEGANDWLLCTLESVAGVLEGG